METCDCQSDGCLHAGGDVDALADDETRCACCSERVLKVSTKPMDNGDVFCLECARDAMDEDDTNPTVVL